MKKYFLLAAIGILSVGVSLFFTIGSDKFFTQARTPPLRIAIDAWPGSAHAFLADKKEIFSKNGVTVRFKFEKGPADSLVSFKKGDVDGVIGGVFSDVILLRADGYPVKVVYITDFSESGDVIIGRAELQTLGDLKGRVVSFETLNSFSHIYVLRALESQGLGEETVRFELVKAPDVLQALEEGRIDAGHTWQPTRSHALAKGYKILSKAGEFPGTITDVLFFNAKTVLDRPNEIQAVVRSLLEAKDYLANHREESLAIMAKEVGMTQEELSIGLSENRQTDLADNLAALADSDSPYSMFKSGDFIIQFLLKRGMLRNMPKISDLLDNRFIQSIHKEKQP